MSQKDIVDMFSVGLSVNDITSRYDLEPVEVGSALANYGYTSDYRKLLPETEVVAASGRLTCSELAKEYDTSVTTILRILKKHGAEGTKKARVLNADTDLLETVIGMYESGMSSVQIADEFGISSTTVIRHLRDNGIDIRTSGESRKAKMHDRYFQTIDSKEKAYWLGILFSNGYVSECMSRWGVSLNHSDHGLITQIIKDLNYQGDHIDSKLSVSSRSMCGDLIAQGLVPDTHDPIGPTSLDKAYSRDFARGVVDATGAINIYPKFASVEFTGAYGVLRWVVDNSTAPLSDPQPHGREWRIRSTKETFRPIVKWLYEDSTRHADRNESKASQILRKFNE